MSQRILVVDDEPDILELVRVNLASSGYEVATAASGNAAMRLLEESPPDLVVLDLMLPDLSGKEICRRIRADSKIGTLPIIMLTARAEEVDRVVGLELGADDYVTKAFSPRELALRIRAILRRQQVRQAGRDTLPHGPLSLDIDSHRCTVEGAQVKLTAKEFQLLHAMLRHPGRVLTRDQLLSEVWGGSVTITRRTIDTHLRRLRRKLGAAGDMIETVRGVGYRLSG